MSLSLQSARDRTNPGVHSFFLRPLLTYNLLVVVVVVVVNQSTIEGTTSCTRICIYKSSFLCRLVHKTLFLTFMTLEYTVPLYSAQCKSTTYNVQNVSVQRLKSSRSTQISCFLLTPRLVKSNHAKRDDPTNQFMPNPVIFASIRVMI